MSEENRPDPDELLHRITVEESDTRPASRGRLKIFFGACAGVGKTYSMLSAAQQALRENIDVVIGVVETHGRPETLKLSEGLPIIPPREIQYRGATLREFDIDAALARKPQLILLDELAHTNVSGSRHPKRWQDVEELLEAGIDVYTTLNVQHLESLNDVVAKVTGIWVRETVPDAFFDAADEISLIDIPSEELLKRLKEGKVYIAPGAKKRAAQNFFKKTNLMALRELALRRTAERVDAQMARSGPMQGWSGTDRILVCIGPDALSNKLVRVAKRMAGSMKAPWTALYVENERHYRLSKAGQEAVERTMRLAERMGGRTEVVQGSRAPDEIIAYARRNGITKIVVGKASRARWREVIYGTLADNIIRRSQDIDVYVVTGDREEQRGLINPFWRTHGNAMYYLSAPAAIGLITLLLLPLRSVADANDLPIAYMIGIVMVAVRFGRGPSILATLLASGAYALLFTNPYDEFNISDSNQLITFVVMMVAGVLTGLQTSRLRLQAIHSRKREQHTSSLYDMTRELAGNRGKDNLAEIAARHIGEVLDGEVSVWMPKADGALAKVVDEGDPDPDQNDDPVREESAARWAFTHKQMAGRGTETLPGARAYYTPLIASGGVVGVIGVAPHGNSAASNDTNTLETFATLAATAIERANAADMIERTRLETESEKLRNILLSSVSHDLRTPLAAITSAASTLLLDEQKITAEYRGELLRLIHEEAARLARMVTNLLDVTSLEAGSVKLNKELYFIEELIGSALMRVEAKLGKRVVTTRIDRGLPLVRMDGLLIEQVLINLLENIAEHTPEETAVSISAKLVKPDIHVIISDNGPGISAGDEERIFDKFYSPSHAGGRAAAAEGGLGLAISRGIVSAHGGKIWAQNNPEGGAIFTFTLPVRAQDVDA